jgi:hypothetical protein
MPVGEGGKEQRANFPLAFRYAVASCTKVRAKRMIWLLGEGLARVTVGWPNSWPAVCPGNWLPGKLARGQLAGAKPCHGCRFP